MMESNVIAVCWMIMILFVCRGVWWLYSKRLERQLDMYKGVLVEDYSAEELAVIVQRNLECPFVGEIGTDENGMLFFQCGAERYDSEIESGRLYIVQKGRFGFNKLRLSEKGRELQQCIADIFSDNPQKDREAFARKKRIARWGAVINWLSGVLLICCALYIPFHMLHGKDIINSKGVSMAQFSNYSTEYTINDALRASCMDGKWSSAKNGDTVYAYFSGETYSGSALKMNFEMNEKGECRIVSTQIDGEDYTLFTGMLLEVMYANIEGED